MKNISRRSFFKKAGLLSLVPILAKFIPKTIKETQATATPLRSGYDWKEISGSITISGKRNRVADALRKEIERKMENYNRSIEKAFAERLFK